MAWFLTAGVTPHWSKALTGKLDLNGMVERVTHLE